MTQDRRQFNLADLYEVVADACGDRLALVAGDVRRTYAQLDERANRVGHHLRANGIEPGDRVGIYAWNRAEWVEAMLGAYKARAVPVNVNYRYVPDELLHVLDDADVVALVVERAFLPLVAAVSPKLPALRHAMVLEDGTSDVALDQVDAGLTVVGYEAALAAARDGRDFGPRSADDWYLLYTGGTTGMPKGVIWRSEDIFFAAMGGGNFAGPPISSPDELAANAERPPVVQVVTAPMMHGGGQWMTFIVLLGCGTLVLYTGRHYDPDEVWGLVETHRAASLMVVGDAMARPLADALAARPGAYELTALAAIGSGGSILSAAVKTQLRQQLPAVMVLDSFGASETGAGGSVRDLDGPAAGPRFTMGPFMNVLDDGLRRVVPGSGQIGWLARRGHIPLGYHKDPVKTAATFRVDASGTRWVLPGDAAKIEEDGAITLLGRGSVSINTGGEKVFPEEVEAVVKAHPDVFDAVVVGVADERFGERVAAVVSLRPGHALELDDLRAHCQTSLAGYKVPRGLIVVDEVLRTPVGKPDYRWAAATARAGEGARKEGAEHAHRP